MRRYGYLQNAIGRSLLQPNVTTPLPDNHETGALERFNNSVEG